MERVVARGVHAQHLETHLRPVEEVGIAVPKIQGQHALALHQRLRAHIVEFRALLAPVAAQFGIDPVHFGIIFILNASIGTITPPLGTVMFTTCSITGVKVPDFIRAIMPYWLLLVGLLLVVTFVPAVSMTLPNAIF